jgi:hypothetical protein
MFRSVQLTVPPARTQELVSQIRSIPGLLSLRLQQGVCIEPPGDLLTADLTSVALGKLLKLLDEQGLSNSPHFSVTTTEPTGVFSTKAAREVARDTSDASWEEMEGMIAKESNMTTNALIVMAVAGMLASIGIATNALHLVIAAMVIAPGFEPIVRISLGVMANSPAWKIGCTHTLKGFVTLTVAAGLTSLALAALGKPPLGSEASYLPAGVLMSYWTQISLPGLLVTAAGGIAGALLIATHRSVLTAGVMVALALVPSSALLGMGIASGEFQIARQGLVRWLIEVTMVLISSLVVFAWKSSSIQKRPMMFTKRAAKKH